jgi:hypothetical protein
VDDSRRPDNATPENLCSGGESNCNRQLGCNANDRPLGRLNKIWLPKKGWGSCGCCAKLVCADSEVIAREGCRVASKHVLLY